MNQHVETYFNRLSSAFGEAWTRFWFTPSDPATISAIRLLTGLVVVYLHATLSLDLITFFGPQGMLPVPDISLLEGNTFSYLNHVQGTGELWAVHLLGLGVLVLFALGAWTRITSILALLVFLSVVHRAPMITGRTESIVAMVMLYLCLAPCGRRFSLDAWMAGRKKNPLGDPSSLSTAATLATRLIQIHLALLVAMMGFSQLGGDVWWNGSGMWFLITRQESRLVDFTWLESYPLLVNFWTHLIVAFELTFAVLIWAPLARPILLAIGAAVWTSLGLVTGDLTFSLMLIVASLAFVSPGIVSVVAARRGEQTAG